jgi:hypothetical protein
VKPYTLKEFDLLDLLAPGLPPFTRLRATVEALAKAEARIRVLEGELDCETLLATNLAEERDEAVKWRDEYREKCLAGGDALNNLTKERDEAWASLDAIAAIPEVDAAEGGEDDAVRNALAKLKAERDTYKAEAYSAMASLASTATENQTLKTERDEARAKLQAAPWVDGNMIIQGEHEADCGAIGVMMCAHVEDLVRAREEQREACAKSVVAIGPAPLRGTYDNGVDDSVDAVRATLLTATPLADRIRVLEAENAALREALERLLKAQQAVTKIRVTDGDEYDDAVDAARAALATDGGTWLWMPTPYELEKKR